MSVLNNNRQSQDVYFQFSSQYFHCRFLKIKLVNIHDPASKLHANFGGVEVLLSNWIWNSTMQMPHW